MKKVHLLASASTTSLLVMSLMTTPAYAWHPVGKISKLVQNQTANTAQNDADIEANAVSAAPGDMLVYSITVRNDGAPASDGNNDMAKTVMTDTLPKGVELVSNPATRTITEDLGTIAPGKSVTKTYNVKVTSQTNGDVITNEACFTGNSKVNDNPQHGCNVAVVKVKVPTKPTPTPTPTPTPGVPITLPDTGSTALTAAIVTSTTVALGFALNTLRLKRRSNA
jgi:uncharacterized repeat protein (TIGR01451 family)